ncbi:MAG: FTR1 family protein [Thaumarchaeota archaeon]|nr:FTR1 family protein [Nitrososphaerota archaeon]MCL5318956.1 FTR1 family protein [Nitrososphaerota archaeon]
MISVETLVNSSAPLLITFREALEAALIVGILAAYLKKIGRPDLNRHLLLGVVGAVATSIVAGGVAAYIYGGLEGVAAELFEGLASISATAVLTYMIFWMTRNARSIRGELEAKINTTVTRGYVYGITVLAFVAVAREGLETVLFLTAFAVRDFAATLVGMIVGVGAVIGLSFLMMRGIYRLDIRRFFKYTSTLLLIFSAGLFGYGVHELMEAAEHSGIEIGPLAAHAYDINPAESTSIFHENGIVGSILKALVGYDGNPEWLRVIAYLGYWAVIGGYLVRSYRSTETSLVSVKDSQKIASEAASSQKSPL